MWKPEEIEGLPVVRYLKVLSSEALSRGRIEFTGGEFDPPGFDENLYVPPFQEAMQLALMLFASLIYCDHFVLKDLKLAAKYYPCASLASSGLPTVSGWLVPLKLSLLSAPLAPSLGGCDEGRAGTPSGLRTRK